ncbi:isopentenyl-diphosphate Delta-isomerase [Parafrigoribacterium soli]|uniref:isopentenyl-diphosphate Delta-isomerase n=1 Tax=Parafrigoribacterium soli TaxID=3144663 RepID=UPI0032ED0F69
MATASDTEDVELLDANGETIGLTSQASVHGPDTPLHLAFSGYVFNARGEVLITRRASTRARWPGVWSNSFCGHPAPAETLASAVRRRAAYEVGLDLTGLEPALPLFRYRHLDRAHTSENEVCPIYVASTSQEPTVHPAEVMDHAWVDPLDLGRSIRLNPSIYGPWLVLQAQLLSFLGGSQPRTAAPPQRERERV